MSQAALRPSKSLGKLLRFKRKQAGMTLRQVGQRLEAAGEPLPTSTLSHIEQGKLDPGSRRLHLLLRLFKIPSETVSDLIDLETQGIGIPEPTDFDTMLAGANAAWSAGDPNVGLAWFLALQHLCVDGDPRSAPMQAAVLSFARGLLRGRRVELARRILDQVLADGVHPEMRERMYVFASEVWRCTGNLDVAMAFLQRAEAEMSPGDREALARIMHERALLELGSRRPEAADESLQHALGHYTRSGQRRSEAEARILRIRILREAGRMEDAIRQARATVRMARKHGFARAAESAQIQLGRTLVEAGRAEAALDPLHASLTEAMRHDHQPQVFDAHSNLWKAHRELGDETRARLELEKAGLHARFVESDHPDLAEVREALRRLDRPARNAEARKKA